MQIKDVVILGSGNLATSLAIALHKAGKNIVYIYSRTLDHAKVLAQKCETQFTDDIRDLPKSADLYIIACSDSSVKEIAEKLVDRKGIIVHTSGSIPLSVFSDQIGKFGVFYPLMTFSKNNEISFNNIPVCIEANSADIVIALYKFAKSITRNIAEVSSEKRKMLHLAAVFACNFTNLNYTVAEDLLQRNQLSFDLLRPLIVETALKTAQGRPSELQTGPAIREDDAIMKEQMESLNEIPEYKEMYKLLSKLIISIKHKND